MNDTSKKKCEVAFKISCDLGEGPVWDKTNKRVLWVDITRCKIHAYSPVTNEHTSFDTNQMVGAIALTESGEIMAAMEQGFVLVDMAGKRLKPVIDPEAHIPNNRFNDGKCDPAGRFWAGTTAKSGGGTGTLYTLEPHLVVAPKIEEVKISNGMAWSPDHKTFYFIDTATSQVAAYDYNISDGSITNKRVIINIAEQNGYPDGMTIDNEGMLWIALWDGWKAGRWNPNNGELLEYFAVPVSRPTSCTFGGDTMQDLYITSASYGLTNDELKQQPLAGSLFVIKNIGFKGFAPQQFKMTSLK